MKQFIEGLGFDPILSEQNNFPINPAMGTVDNCLAVVESKADIFVPIVGARYGSVNDRDKSVTNLEFLTARSKGIPQYVFVSRSVLDILPVWKTNRSADFSNVTDSPKLFEFVAGIRDSGECWVFPFDTAQDIFEVLRMQLAYLFSDSLELRLKARAVGGLSPKFRNLPGTVFRIIIERPVAWEYLLFSEALESELRTLSDIKRDWSYRLAKGPGLRMNSAGLIKLLGDKLAEVRRITAILGRVVNQALPAAFGPPGVSGDPEAILHAANRVAMAYRDAMEWKLDLYRYDVPHEMERVRDLMGRFCDNMVAEVEEFSHTINTALKNALADVKQGKKAAVSIMLKLTVPDQSEIQPEFERLSFLLASGSLR